MQDGTDRALVTGAAGFIGGHVVTRWSRAGRQVIALDRPGSSFAHLPASVDIREADVTDPRSLARALEDASASVVIHCAALMGGWGSAEAYHRVNVEGTRHVADWAGARGVGRFVYLSSVSVYGMPPVSGITEETPFKQIGLPYADSKMAAERLVLHRHGSGLPVTILRPGDVYGPRAGEWVVKLVDALRAGRMILIGGGRGLINTTHVDNLVDAIEAACSLPGAVGRDYIITDGTPVDWKTYLSALADAAGLPRPRLSLPTWAAWPAVLGLEAAGAVFGRRPPLTRMGLRLLTARCSYDIARARDELGWSPGVDFAKGMADVGRWLEQSGS